MSRDSAIVLSETEHRKDAEGHLFPLVGDFDYYCQILESFHPLGRMKFWLDIFLRNLSPINEDRQKNQGENGVHFSKGLERSNFFSEIGTY